MANTIDIKELKETWYTKSELKKINNESSPQRVPLADIKKTESEAREQQQYNLIRVKVEEQEAIEGQADQSKQGARVDKRRKPLNNRQKKWAFAHKSTDRSEAKAAISS